MTTLRNSLRRMLCAVVLLVAVSAAAPRARAASDWQVIKVGGWDYLTVDNIAKFYSFPPTLDPINKTIRLDNGRNSLEVTLDSREAIVNGVRNWLCFPVLAGKDGKYLVSRIDLAKTIEPQFRPQLVGTVKPLKTVVIDPGHGGIEKGAGSTYGNEKDFTLDVAKQLKPMLEAQGLKVIMTRDSDAQVPLPERARIANSTRDSIFVSIHFNSADANGNATGFEIYSLTPRGAPSTQDMTMQARFAAAQNGNPVDGASLTLSYAVYHSMLGHLPEFDRGIKRARFAVLRLTSIPGILVEGGFLSERQESRMIASPEWRGKLAKAIAVGIENYRALSEKKKRPMLLADYRREIDGVLVARNANGPVSPDAAAAPVVRTASNVTPLAGAAAQMTTPLRHEPSPQLTAAGAGGEGPDDDDEPEGTPSVAPTPMPQASVVAATQGAANGQQLPNVAKTNPAPVAEATPQNQPPTPTPDASSTEASVSAEGSNASTPVAAPTAPNPAAESAEALVTPPSTLHVPEATDASAAAVPPTPTQSDTTRSPMPSAAPSAKPTQSWKDWFLSFFKK